MTLREEYLLATNPLAENIIEAGCVDESLVITPYVFWLEQQIYDKDILLDAYSAGAKSIEELIRLREEAAFKAGWYMSSNIANNTEGVCEIMFNEWRKSK